MQAVVNIVFAQGVPPSRGIDSDDWLVQPALGFVSQTQHTQIGACLDNRIDPGSIDFDQRLAQLVFTDMSNGYRSRTFESLDLLDLHANIFEKFDDVLIANCLIRRDHSDRFSLK